jgi:zinc carboxypeptidase
MDVTARLVSSVPPIPAFPTVDEMEALVRGLADRHPERVEVSEVGRSRGGDPITEVRVGDGQHHVVVVGNPHPDEPIGMATIRHLLQQLCADPALAAELDATWHFVPCVDPDGTRLNEGWFAGPFDRDRIARAVYRPPAEQQPEWTFPAQWNGVPFGRPLPETRALMAVVDRARPALVASLHNGELGGGFFYVTGGDPDYWSELVALLHRARLPLHLGEPDAPGARPLATAVFEVPAVGAVCDALAASGIAPTDVLTGGGIRDYTAPHGSSVLVSELPLWADPRAGDTSPGDRSAAAVVRAAAAAYREVRDVVGGVLERVGAELSGTTPFQDAVVRSLPLLDAAARPRTAGDGDRPASVAEIFLEERAWPSVLALRTGGMLLRLLDAETRPDAPAVAAERAAFAAVFDRWCRAARDLGRPVPLADLVAVQTGAIATAVTRIRDGRPV